MINALFEVFLQINPDKQSFLNYFFNVTYAFIFLYGAIIACTSFRKHTLQTLEGKSLFFYGLALLSYTLGQFIWSFYNLILKQEIPYPGASDIFFLLFVPFAAAGFIFLLKSLGGRFSIGRLIEFILVTATMYIVLITFLGQSISGTSVTFMQTLLGYLYPLMDSILVSLAIVGLRTEKGGLHPNLLIFVFASLFLAAADTLFSYLSSIGTYWNGDISDLFFFISGSLFAWGVISASGLLVENKNFPDESNVVIH